MYTCEEDQGFEETGKLEDEAKQSRLELWRIFLKQTDKNPENISCSIYQATADIKTFNVKIAILCFQSTSQIKIGITAGIAEYFPLTGQKHRPSKPNLNAFAFTRGVI